MPRIEELDGQDIFLIREFLSPGECAELIEMSERLGFEDAPISTRGGAVMAKEIRNNARVMSDDPALANSLWEKAQPFLPAAVPYQGQRWRAIGLNDRLRFYRYDAAERFAPHYDGLFRRDNGETSRLTFMVYLNDGFVGGETRFFDHRATPRFDVRPEAGAALVFVHEQLHEGAPVLSGRKYVLRSDVMYRVVAGSP